MTPSGLSARTWSSGAVQGSTTEKTLNSRMRRAMSWVYCDPKSRITIVEVSTEAIVNASQRSIERRLAFGPGLPAAVHPEPLVRMPPDDVFEHGGEAGGVLDGIGFGVAGGDERDLGQEVQDVFLFRFLPDEEAGDDGGAGLERDAGEARSGTGERTEEGYEDSLRRGHVGVHQDADGLAGAHCADQPAGKVVLVQDAVAVAATDAVDHAVDERIVQAADDHTHGIA